MSDIRCRNLCKTFHQGGETITALDQVSLDIGEGAFVCLSGPSGSGKTTLLNALGGLDTPDSGTIAIGEQRLEHLSRRQRADLRLHHIGFVFQAYNLITVLSARENVEFIMQVQGVPAKEREKLATGVLADEPTANLDSRSAARLMDLFVTLNRERGVTFVISTHDARVMGYARRLIGMRDGRIVSDQEQQPHAMAI